MVGAAYAVIIYYRNKANGFGPIKNAVLFTLRSITVALISFLLLTPLLKSVVRRLEKPIVIIALDNSESMLLGKDSATVKGNLIKDLMNLTSDLESSYEVVTYNFSDEVKSGLKGDFKGKQTDMAELIMDLRTRYSNRNVAALLLASDGIVTRGANPVYVSEKEPYSIYAIALGDTNQRKDLLLSKISYNRIAYLGNTFPVEITVTNHRCAGSASRLTVSSGDQMLFSKEMLFSSDESTVTVPVTLKASVAGVQKFRIGLQPVAGELSTANNYKDIFVEVLDGKQKILVLFSAPHPDITAFRSSVENNMNYDVHVHQLNDFKGDVSAFNLAVLCQIPSVQDAGSQILARLQAEQIPVLYLLGEQTNLAAFNALQAGLNIPLTGNSFTPAYPLINNNFNLFSLRQEVVEMITEYPPLSVPFGQYKSGTSSDVLAFQRIGSVNTAYPLIVLSPGIERKTGIIAGEGIWRWRMINFMKAGNHNAFDELISKMVQYLAVKTDKSQFRIFVKNYFNENDIVELDAELYNDSYELINEPEISLSIRNEDGKDFPFSFSRTSNAYYLNAGSFPPGEYTYKAVVMHTGKSLQKTGTFSIAAVNEESLNTVANHSLLYTLAKQHRGQMLRKDEISSFKELLREREDVKTVSYSRKKFTDLVNLPWVLMLLIALLSIEWFIRKRSGSY